MDGWIQASYQSNVSNIWPMDVYTMISAHAQFLRAVCVNAQRGIGFVLIDSLAASLVSANVLPEALVELQVNIAEQSIRSAGQWQLLVLISFVRMTTASIGINVYQLDNQSPPCYCVSMNNCLVPGAIYQINPLPTFGYYHIEIWKNFSIPIKGIQMGCYAMESALSSTLEYYYTMPIVSAYWCPIQKLFHHWHRHRTASLLKTIPLKFW